jgi:ligand-binding sensor domain-containing protein
MCIDNNNTLWLAWNNNHDDHGLISYTEWSTIYGETGIRREPFHQYYPEFQHEPMDCEYKMSIDNNNNIWIGAEYRLISKYSKKPSGLHKFDGANGTRCLAEKYKPGIDETDNIYDIAIDHSNNVWVTTDLAVLC